MKHRLAAVAVILLLGMAVAAQTVSIQLAGNAFRVAGWTPPSSPPAGGWSAILAIYAGTGDIPPMLGTYAVENGALVFHPRYPVAAGLRYRAVFHAPGRPPIVQFVDGPARVTTPTTRVEHIYPSADVLPSNTLRFYIYFSAPMSRGNVEQWVKMLDAKGQPLSGVFLPGEELWDPASQRLTMTLDPGRIKRGLVSNQKMGPPIAEGQSYLLAIDGKWPDARGVALTEGFRKSFKGGPAVRTAPDPREWRITAPRSNTSDPVVLMFPRPMNYPLLQRMVRVSGPQGMVAGSIGVAREEMEWRLTPLKPWTAGRYDLILDTGLEDLAANHIGQLFDIDVFDKVTQHITSRTISLPFEVKTTAVNSGLR